MIEHRERPRLRHRWIPFLIPVALVGCDSDPIQTQECRDDTDALEITVTVDGGVVFDWLPECEISLLLVEEGASDVWLIQSPTGGNTISPPVTYGTVPQGATEGMAPENLVNGTTYDVILFRDLPGEGGGPVGTETFVR